MPGSFSLPHPADPATGAAPVSAVVRENFQAIQSQLNNADGAALQAHTVTEQALADTVNDRLFRTEAGVTFVATGIASGFSGLTASLSSGVAYVNGYRIAYLGETKSLALNSDYYADMSSSGSVIWGQTTNGGTPPTLAAGSLRLAKWVTNGSAITSTTSLANLTAAGFGPAVQTFTNGGSAGGTFFYLNLGGFKLMWGKTTAQTIGGSAPASATLTVVPPTGFFNSIQTVQANAGPPGSNTQYAFVAVPTMGPTSISLYFNQVVGSAAIFAANVFVIGT